MSILYMLKMLADLSFYFTFANGFLALFGASSALLTIPVFGICILLCALLRNKKWLRFLPLSTLMICYLILPLSMQNTILLLPPTVYMILHVYNLKNAEIRKTYDEVFYLYLKLCIPFVIFMLIVARQDFETASVPFMLIYFASATALMRTLRQSSHAITSAGFNGLNILSVIIVFLVCGTISFRPVLNLILKAATLVYQYIITPILLFTASVMYRILNFLMGLLPPPHYPIPEEIESEELLGAAEEVTYMAATSIIIPVISAIVTAALLAAAIYNIIKWIQRYRSNKKVRIEYQEHFIEAARPEARGATKQSQNMDRQIRKYYERFLLLCQKNNIQRTPDMTSADFAKMSSIRFDLPDEAAEFRQHYIKVRYGESTASRTDVRRVRTLYNRFKKAAKN